MSDEFPGAVPEIPVTDVDQAARYYRDQLGFTIQWGDENGGGIGGIWRGRCRLFLTNPAFRERHGNPGKRVPYWEISDPNVPTIDQLSEILPICLGSDGPSVGR